MHTLNDQVFRGFFTGRYLFDSVTGFLRYASPAAAGGFGPATIGCSDGSYVTLARRPARPATTTGGPLLFYLQGAGRPGWQPMRPAPRTSRTTSCRCSCRTSGRPRPNLTVNYGLRWDAQLMPETVDPRTTAFGAFLNDPAFPSDGTIPDQWNMWQPRVGVAWDVTRSGQVGGARQRGRLLRAPEHAQPGRDR